jgi:MFS family permease
MKKEHNFFTGLSKTTFLLAFTSFFGDISTEMLYPILPIFLTQVLFAPVAVVGIVEGIAEAMQNIVQGFSGRLADKIQNNKKVALFGYGIAAVAKPFMGLAMNWEQLLFGRALDRLASGTRSAPRDALIASSTDEQHRGRAFGLEGIGDNMGAVVGPLLAVLFLYALHLQLRLIFYLAFIPGLLAFLLIMAVKQKSNTPRGSIPPFRLNNLPAPYWKYILAIALAGIGNSSNAFLILRAKNIGIPIEATILVYAIFNLVAALSSYPAGSLSDKLGRRNILIFSFCIFIITYLGFAFSRNILLIALLFVLYGSYQGIFRAVGKAMATDLIPLDLRATGIGIYSTVIGLTSLIASIVGGFLWDKVNPSATFLYGALFAGAGIIALIALTKNRKQIRLSGF